MSKSTRCLPAWLGLLLAACGSPTVTPSVPVAPAERSPSTSPAVLSSPESTPSPSATAMPSPSLATSAEDAGTDFLLATIVEVVVDGLAVRRGPGTAYEHLGAARFTADGAEQLDTPYRLMAGEELSIQRGPLRVDGTAWYSVRLRDVMWVTPDGTDSTVEGWVAAGEGDIAYLQVRSVPNEACCFHVSGVGSGVTPPLPRVPTCPDGFPCGDPVGCRPR